MVHAATIREITDVDMYPDILCEEYEDCSPGLMSGTEACLVRELGLEKVSSFGPYSTSTDTLDSGTFGNAICANSDQLAVIAESGSFQVTNYRSGFRFEFPPGITPRQFSFQAVDQANWDMLIVVFDGGVEIASLHNRVGSGFPTAYQYFQCSDPFEALEIRQDGTSAIGWCLDKVCFADFTGTPHTPTPTPTPTGTFLTATPTPSPTATTIPVSDRELRGLMLVILGILMFSFITSRLMAKPQSPEKHIQFE